MGKRIFKITEAQYNLLKKINEEVVVGTDKNFRQGTNITDANKKLNQELSQAGINIKNNPNVEKKIEVNDPTSPTGELEVKINDKNPTTQSQQTENRVISVNGIREDVMRKLKQNSTVYTLNDLKKKRI